MLLVVLELWIAINKVATYVILLLWDYETEILI